MQDEVIGRQRMRAGLHINSIAGRRKSEGLKADIKEVNQMKLVPLFDRVVLEKEKMEEEGTHRKEIHRGRFDATLGWWSGRW